jgi:hypothetical protein
MPPDDLSGTYGATFHLFEGCAVAPHATAGVSCVKAACPQVILAVLEDICSWPPFPPGGPGEGSGLLSRGVPLGGVPGYDSIGNRGCGTDSDTKPDI